MVIQNVGITLAIDAPEQSTRLEEDKLIFSRTTIEVVVLAAVDQETIIPMTADHHIQFP